MASLWQHCLRVEVPAFLSAAYEGLCACPVIVCCHCDLQSTVLDQSHPVTPTATAAPLYTMCISANHGAVSSIPGGNHLTMHSLDFCFFLPLTSTSILNLMTSEPAQSHRLWIQHWFSCDSAFLPLNHQFLVFSHNFHVINVWFGWGIDDFSNVVHLLYQIFSWELIKKIILYGNQWSHNNYLRYLHFYSEVYLWSTLRQAALKEASFSRNWTGGLQGMSHSAVCPCHNNDI